MATKTPYTAIELQEPGDQRVKRIYSDEESNEASQIQPRRTSWSSHKLATPFRVVQTYYRRKCLERDNAKALINKSSIRFIPMVTHLTTIAAALVLVVLNLQGCFIGYKFAATHHDNTQALSLLALQVCAKFIEIITVASLALIISDFLHYFLLFDENGLPLGLSGVKLDFANIFFLISPGFWAGVFSFKAKRARALAAFLIISCGLLATFIGPSSALLLIPTIRSGWLAGQVQVTQYELNYPLYPTQFNETTSNLTACSSVDLTNIDLSLTQEFEHCPWFSVFNISMACKGLFPADTDQDFLRNMTVHDGTHRRAILYSSVNVTTGVWAVSGPSRINYMNYQIYQLWLQAVSWASDLLDITYFARWYFLREIDGNVAEVTSQLPAVLTKCYVQEGIFFNTSTAIDFPALPFYGPATDGLFYIVHPNMTSSTNSVISSWVNPPANYTLDPNLPLVLPFGYFPSAALFVQIPYQNSTTEGKVIACSVDARWVQGTNTFLGFVGDSPDSAILYPVVNDDVAGSEMSDFSPVDDGTWTSVKLDVAWLNILTLHSSLNSSKSSTVDSSDTSDSISWFITNDGYSSNRTTDLASIADIYTSNSWNVHILELFISASVADAMARFNVDQNVVNMTQLADGPNEDYDTKVSSIYKPLLGGSLQLSNTGSSIAVTDPLTWTIYISGYSYKADSTAYYLSIIVVLTALAFVVTHVIYLLLKQLHFSKRWPRLRTRLLLSHSNESEGWSSKAWGSVEDMIRLALQSPQQSLKSGSIGPLGAYIERQPLLMLRVPDHNDMGPVPTTRAGEYRNELSTVDEGRAPDHQVRERVHLIEAQARSLYHRAEKGKKYD